MEWVGFYIAAASCLCTLPMAADQNVQINPSVISKFWIPSKYSSLNAASITVIAVAMKLPLDLTTAMPTLLDQAAKVGSLAFMCAMMGNLMPSLASTDNNTLLTNMTGLCILVITMFVNVCIQISTGVIENKILVDRHMNFPVVAGIYAALMLLLLVIMISLSLAIPTCKDILETKYQAIVSTNI